MRSLIPAENWEYNLSDLFYILTNTFIKDYNNKKINIDKIGECIPIRSGRAAIVAALRALDLKHGAKIGVPLYSCPVVFKAVEKVGFTPMFIDIEPDTFCMSAKYLSKKINQVDAVIAIHMFGNLCDMSALMEVAKGKSIIEDCAQSIGSKINGRMSGTIGKIGIFSFRSGKYLSVGEGGALYSSDSKVFSRLFEIISAMKIPSKTDELNHIIKTYLRSKLRSRPLFGLIGKKIWQIYNKTVDYPTKTPIILSQILNHDLCLTVKRLLNFDKAIELQRANAEFYSNNLKLNYDMLCYEKLGTFYNRYNYPIIFNSIEQRDFISAYLYKNQIDTIKPYEDIREVASKYYGYKGDCPITEDISKRILLIPNHYALKKKDITKIAKCLNLGWIETQGS